VREVAEQALAEVKRRLGSTTTAEGVPAKPRMGPEDAEQSEGQYHSAA